MTDGGAMLMSMFFALNHSGSWSETCEANLLDVGALEPHFFATLVTGRGFAPEQFVQYDKTGWPAMQAAFAVRFVSRGRDEWAAVFEGSDACASPVLGTMEAPLHPQNAARGAHQQANGVLHPTPAPRFAGASAAARRTCRALQNLARAGPAREAGCRSR